MGSCTKGHTSRSGSPVTLVRAGLHVAFSSFQLGWLQVRSRLDFASCASGTAPRGHLLLSRHPHFLANSAIYNYFSSARNVTKEAAASEAATNKARLSSLSGNQYFAPATYIRGPCSAVARHDTTEIRISH